MDVSITISPIIDRQERVVGTSLIARDITMQKKAAEELKKLNAELERRVRERTAGLENANRELKEFVFVASHDLQEPLRKVTGFGERLEATATGKLDEKERDFLKRMVNAATRMQSLIDDLLAISRITTKASRFERVDLGQVLGGVLDDLDLVLEKTGTIIIRGQMETIDADATQMRQLLQNLIGNAVKFRREGVRPVIRVSAEKNRETVELVGRSGAPGEACLVTVSDNGIGFEQKYAEKIFVVFQRLHGQDEYGGTGVGLAICKKIAERHGGAVVAKGTPGKGAVFTVILPMRQTG